MGSNFFMKIGDISEVFDGPHATPKKIDVGPYFLSISSLEQGQLDLSKSAHLSEEQFIKWTKRVTPQEGDVLFSYETRLGEAALMPAGVTACLGRRMGLLRPDRTKVLPEYLLYAYLSPAFQQEIKKRTIHGATVERIALRELPDFNIRVPTLGEQEKVVANLNAINGKINLNNQTNQTLEQMAQTLFKSWFVDFDPVFDNLLAKFDFKLENLPSDFPEPLLKRAEVRLLALDEKAKAALTSSEKSQTNTHKHFPNEFEHNEQLGWIPKGWNASYVGKEFDVTMGQSPPGSTYNEVNEGIPFFQGKTDYGFRFPSNRIYCTAPKRLAQENDTLVSVRAPVGTINLAAEHCAIGRGLAAVRHKSGSISFTYYAMNDLAKHFEVFEGEGTVFGSINQKDFNALPQLSHPSILVTTFNMFCADWDEKIKLTSLQINELTKLRDTLLPKLISGEITLTDSQISSEA